MGMSFQRGKCAIGAVLLALGLVVFDTGSAHAESLSFRALSPAQVDLPGSVETIATERFTGREGPDLELALSDALGSVQIEGQSWFRVVPTGSPLAGDGPDAVMRGSLSREVTRPQVNPRTESVCVERDENDKCVERDRVEIPCREMRVRLTPRILLFTLDGRQLYSRSDSFAASRRYCQGDDWPSANAMTAALIDDVAHAVRFDLAPVDQVLSLRIMERRKGLKGDARDAFKAAVKLSNSDQAASCEAFAALYQQHSDQSSVIYNHGLCQERGGDLEAARTLYLETLRVDPGRDYAEQGLARIAGHQRAREQVKRGLGDGA
ncbi:MAG: hypothetical protein AAF251_02260 [Pseudomonadota bacterium]